MGTAGELVYRSQRSSPSAQTPRRSSSGGRSPRRASALLAGGLVVALAPPAASATTAAAAAPGPAARPVGTAAAGPSAAVPGAETAPGTAIGGPLLASRGLVLAVPPGVPAPPQVLAKSFVVADATSGQVLAAKGAHVQSRPASTLKTLTALTLHPRLSPEQVYRARPADAAIEGSRVGIVAGATYPVRDLFAALFLRSGNDAASALANAAGGEAVTVAAMNRLASELGARDTVARNPSGLDADGQLTSAYDLALIGRAALENPAIARYAVLRRQAFPGAMPAPGRARPTFEIQNKQVFVQTYPGAVGVKNGYTSKARGTLIAAARRGGRTVLVTLLHSEGNIWQEAAALSNWAFQHGADVSPVGRLVRPEDLRPVQVLVPARAAASLTRTGTVGAGLEEGGPTGPAAVAVAAGGAGVLVGLVLVTRRRVRRRPS